MEWVVGAVALVYFGLLGISYSEGWSHKFLDWHYPSDAVGFDGASATSRCKICGLRIGQDSQGGWFAFTRQDGEG